MRKRNITDQMRKELAGIIDSGVSVDAIAKTFGVPATVAWRWINNPMPQHLEPVVIDDPGSPLEQSLHQEIARLTAQRDIYRAIMDHFLRPFTVDLKVFDQDRVKVSVVSSR